jgi:hypothetical protein
MSSEAITGAVERVLRASIGRAADERSVDARVARFVVSKETSELAASHPRLLRTCCEAVTPEAQATVRHFLPVMLNHLRDVEQGSATLEDASISVGRVLGDRYLPQQLPPSAGSPNGKEA